MSFRDELARIVETVAKEGLPGPRDLDVALDAIESTIVEGLSWELTLRLAGVYSPSSPTVRKALQAALRVGE